MTDINSTTFYVKLPVLDASVSSLLADPSAFADVPADWHVIVTDIRNSTEVVKAGRQNAVNLIATGSIIAALNIAEENDTDLPFFFGGDGASLLVPPALLEVIFQALLQHRRNAYRNFFLELRVGYLSVQDIYAAGHSLRIARLRKTEFFAIPVVLGNGLKYADRLIKGWNYSQYPHQRAELRLNLSGMECRWNTIPPPGELTEVVCLLVDVAQEDQQAQVYQHVLDQIEAIYGSEDTRRPISSARMKLTKNLWKIATEVRVKFGQQSWAKLLRTWLIVLFGTFYLRFNTEGKQYLSSIMDLTDTLVIDGRIATVISGTADQRSRLVAALDAIESKGNIRYGIHVSPESIMSCYVRNRLDQHIHFVDGSGGGYTRAARMLKAKKS